MGIYIHVKGFRDSNSPAYLKHIKAMEFCDAYGLSYPKETQEYFEGVDRPEDVLEVELPTTEWSDPEMLEEGFEIKVADIPKGVYKIRAILSA